MYLSFYNLKSEPFNITPDPELLFMSPSHKEALAAVICGVNRRKGFVAIIGEVGVGKTTIIRSFLERINASAQNDKEGIKTIYIFNANISFKALLKTIYENIGHTPKSEDIYSMIDQLHLLLIEEYKSGNNVVVIIDEAQNMPVETLENLRMLSNLETSSDKLIQVVLCGQPEFEQKLNLHELRQLKQRVAIRVRILPLSKNESFEYINHRLARTVTKDPDIFTQGALNKIVREAGGIPRNINILCDNCLVTAFGNQQKKVTTKVAKEIITDHRMEKNGSLVWKVAIVLTSLIIVTFSIWGYGMYRTPNKLPEPSKQVSNKPEPREVIQKPEVIQSQAVSLVEQKPVTKTKGYKSDATLEFKPKIIKRGDTLAGLIRDTYGSVDNKLFKLIIKNNPQISNINRIQEGDKLFLPAKD